MRSWTPEDVHMMMPGVVVILAIIGAVALGTLDPHSLPGLTSVLTGAIGWAGGHAFGLISGAKRRRADDPPVPGATTE